MAKTNTYTAIIEREGDMYVAPCPELDVASQGVTVEEATANLKEAVELFLETADAKEVERRRGSHIVMQRRANDGTTTIPVPDHRELKTGTLLSIIRQSGIPRQEFESD